MTYPAAKFANPVKIGERLLVETSFSLYVSSDILVVITEVALDLSSNHPIFFCKTDSYKRILSFSVTFSPRDDRQ